MLSCLDASSQVNGSPLHFGLTLISILRLGITDATRDKLYQSFLDMPLYEDMAPWNIFFEAGKLIYIDYDTRNLHFDEAVPMAYQVPFFPCLCSTAPTSLLFALRSAFMKCECIGSIVPAEFVCSRPGPSESVCSRLGARLLRC